MTRTMNKIFNNKTDNIIIDNTKAITNNNNSPDKDNNNK